VGKNIFEKGQRQEHSGRTLDSCSQFEGSSPAAAVPVIGKKGAKNYNCKKFLNSG
jgi:hypothetical protein